VGPAKVRGNLMWGPQCHVDILGRWKGPLAPRRQGVNGAAIGGAAAICGPYRLRSLLALSLSQSSFLWVVFGPVRHRQGHSCCRCSPAANTQISCLHVSTTCAPSLFNLPGIRNGAVSRFPSCFWCCGSLESVRRGAKGGRMGNGADWMCNMGYMSWCNKILTCN
jgi:hypothetical protein